MVVVTAVSVRCSGCDPQGRWIINRPVHVQDLREYVYGLFEAGWARASVEDTPGHVVGWVAPAKEGGKITWGLE